MYCDRRYLSELSGVYYFHIMTTEEAFSLDTCIGVPDPVAPHLRQMLELLYGCAQSVAQLCGPPKHMPRLPSQPDSIRFPGPGHYGTLERSLRHVLCVAPSNSLLVPSRTTLSPI